MDVEIGMLNAIWEALVPARAGSDVQSEAPGEDPVDAVLPPAPPQEALDEIDAAAERVARLTAGNRELHFEIDEGSTGVVIHLCDLEGRLIRLLSPCEALDVMSGMWAGEELA